MNHAVMRCVVLNHAVMNHAAIGRGIRARRQLSDPPQESGVA
jgi:hypothetical protein